MLNSKESKKTKKYFQEDVANLQYIKLEQVICIKKADQKIVGELLKSIKEDQIEGQMHSYFEETVKFDFDSNQLLESEVSELNLSLKDKSNDIFQVACMDMTENIDVLNRVLNSYISADYSNMIGLTLCFNVENVDKFFLDLNKKLVGAGYQKLYNITETYVNFVERTKTTIKLSKTDIVLNVELSYDKCEGMGTAYFELLRVVNNIYREYIRGIK